MISGCDIFREGALGPGPVTVRWLGTAGFAVEHEGAVLLLDPYVTRASLGACIAAPLRSDAIAVSRHAPRADAIVVGHTHFDHALDVPAIALQTGAMVFGSRSAAALCRASGVPEARVRDVERPPGGQPIVAEVGPFRLRFVPSAHSRFLFGRVPFPGEIDDCDQVPLRTERYRCGAVFAVEIRVAGRTIVHLGSAELAGEAFEAREPELVLLCTAGWQSSPISRSGWPARSRRRPCSSRTGTTSSAPSNRARGCSPRWGCLAWSRGSRAPRARRRSGRCQSSAKCGCKLQPPTRPPTTNEATGVQRARRRVRREASDSPSRSTTGGSSARKAARAASTATLTTATAGSGM